MNIYRVLLLICSLLLASCLASTSKEVESIVVGHRLIHGKPSLKKETESKQGVETVALEVNSWSEHEIGIALTNSSQHALCRVSAKVVGLYEDGKENRGKLLDNWRPGQIWFLHFAEVPRCHIPIRVELTYDYYSLVEETTENSTLFKSVALCEDSKENTEKYKLIPEQRYIVELPKKPIAIKLSELKHCISE